MFNNHPVYTRLTEVTHPWQPISTVATVPAQDAGGSTGRLQHVNQTCLTSVGSIVAFALDKRTVRACHLSHLLDVEPHVGTKSIRPWRQSVWTIVLLKNPWEA